MSKFLKALRVAGDVAEIIVASSRISVVRKTVLAIGF